MQEVTLFHTPASMDELQQWLTDAKDPMVTTAAMMMWNLIVSKYDLKEK